MRADTGAMESDYSLPMADGITIAEATSGNLKVLSMCVLGMDGMSAYLLSESSYSLGESAESNPSPC